MKESDSGVIYFVHSPSPGTRVRLSHAGQPLEAGDIDDLEAWFAMLIQSLRRRAAIRHREEVPDADT